MFNEFPSFVAEDSRRFISQDTGNLYISKVQPSDVGSYICLVKNTVTNARVLSPPTPLTLKTDGEALRLIAPLTHERYWFVWIPKPDKSNGFYSMNHTESIVLSLLIWKCKHICLYIYIYNRASSFWTCLAQMKIFCWCILLHHNAFGTFFSDQIG